MAFIDFADGLATSFGSAMRPRVADRPADLSALETAALNIGAQDGLTSLRQQGSLLRLLHALFAIRRPNALADTALEAIRRLAVAAHLGADNELRREAQKAIKAGIPASKVVAVLIRFGRPFVDGMIDADDYVARAF